MGKIRAAGDKIKSKAHKKAAQHGRREESGHHAKEAAKYKAKSKAEKHV